MSNAGQLNAVSPGICPDAVPQHPSAKRKKISLLL
jgi:hypothetical protein